MASSRNGRRLRGLALATCIVASLTLLSACGGGNGGSPGSFQSNGPAGAAPTNVTGKSDTSGISAGSALQAPTGTNGTPTPSK